MAIMYSSKIKHLISQCLWANRIGLCFCSRGQEELFEEESMLVDNDQVDSVSETKNESIGVKKILR